ncbi:MAG TPA: LptA/OstA family protein [Alphaproteobacteria bacterium]|nr:LptA/OstA family protein [Alphaproteobacteria bacterium]
MPLLLGIATMLALPALAQQAGQQSAPSLPSAAADKPIQIDADQLEVRQDQNLAIFSGNVQAAQGRIRLRADQVKVRYQARKKGKDQDGGKDGNGGNGGAPAAGTITRIDALGHVFVSSPEETAQGDAGVYEVPAKRITLTGNVVLTRGQNVIRGNRLVLDMASGRSHVEGGSNRVRGLFVPPKSGKNGTK